MFCSDPLPANPPPVTCQQASTEQKFAEWDKRNPNHTSFIPYERPGQNVLDCTVIFHFLSHSVPTCTTLHHTAGHLLHTHLRTLNDPPVAPQPQSFHHVKAGVAGTLFFHLFKPTPTSSPTTCHWKKIFYECVYHLPFFPHTDGLQNRTACLSAAARRKESFCRNRRVSLDNYFQRLSSVTLRIFDPVGREVAAGLDGRRQADQHRLGGWVVRTFRARFGVDKAASLAYIGPVTHPSYSRCSQTPFCRFP